MAIYNRDEATKAMFDTTASRADPNSNLSAARAKEKIQESGILSDNPRLISSVKEVI
jgi:hypothetical protein